MAKYKVTLAHFDGSVTEKIYNTGWDIKKEGIPELIMQSCAVETKIASGRDGEGGYNMPCEGLTAELVAA